VLRFALLITLLVGAPDPDLRAQDSVPARTGMRVRVRLDSVSPWRVGRLVALAADTLRLAECLDCSISSLPLPTGARIEVSVGRPRHAVGGAVLGALFGAAIVAVPTSRCEDSAEGPPCALGYVTLPLFAAGGAMLGAVVGRSIPAGAERWRPAAQRGP
jgi:hypothetical protein